MSTTVPNGSAAPSASRIPPPASDGAGTAPLTTEAARRLGRTPGSRFAPDHGAATMGPGAAAKAVAEDLQKLVQAEIAYAKAEMTAAAKAKGTGAGLLAGAAVLVWLGVQGLLLTIGFGLAAAGLPGWAAAGIVTLVLLLIAGILAWVAKRKLDQPVPLDAAKQRVEEDVTWIKSHLPK